MPKRYMSDSEYEQQQFKWKHNLTDPYILQAVIDAKEEDLSDEEEAEKQKKQDLKDRLRKIVMSKVEKALTRRQREAINIFLMGKKQDYIGKILGTTQESANTRLKLAFQRLRKSCASDQEVQEILQQLKK